MIDTEIKNEYIRLRAEGKSIRAIAKELHINKDTCLKLDKQFEAEISKLKSEHLEELYNNFYMTKEARIKKLGGVLNKIDVAIENTDLQAVPPEKLLDFKLKYTEALKNEYIDIKNNAQNDLQGDFTAKDILNHIGDLLNRLKNGTTTPEQASKESAIYTNLLKAYENTELAEKIKVLEAIIGQRG